MGAAKRGNKVGYTYVVEIANVVRHPLRLKALIEVGRAKGAINPVAVAKETGLPVNDVAYHIRTLAAIGAITLTDTEPVRGATRHLYVIAPYGEEILTWVRKMELYSRKRERDRAAVKAHETGTAG